MHKLGTTPLAFVGIISILKLYSASSGPAQTFFVDVLSPIVSIFCAINNYARLSEQIRVSDHA